MNKSIISNITNKFQETFEGKPLLIFSPGRINLIGEHTDYNDGFAFPAAVDKGIYMAMAHTSSTVSTAIAQDLDDVYQFSLNNSEPLVNGGWKNYIIGVVAEIQKLGIQVPNFNCVFSGDIPNGAGMSSSAALENSVVYALNQLFTLGLSKTQMIYIAQSAEHNFAGVKCGIMDQYASMFGIEDSALLLDCRTIEATPFHIDFQDYQIMLINSNVKHELSESAYNERRAVCEKVSNLLKIKALRDASLHDLQNHKDIIAKEDYPKVSYVVEENKRVNLFAKAIQNNDLETLGKLLYQSHDGLSKSYQVSCEELDFLVAQTEENPKILGARMMGGGFGGCTINLIHNDEVAVFSADIAEKFKNKFQKECSIYQVNLSNGTHLIDY